MAGAHEAHPPRTHHVRRAVAVLAVAVVGIFSAGTAADLGARDAASTVVTLRH